jgi:hypothetical protein
MDSVKNNDSYHILIMLVISIEVTFIGGCTSPEMANSVYWYGLSLSVHFSMTNVMFLME